MTKYPEWFIGGPLHGEDKLVRFPDAYGMVLWIEYAHSWTHDHEFIISKLKWQYQRRTFCMGSVVIRIWVDEYLSELEATTLLGELIMKPHEVQRELNQ